MLLRRSDVEAGGATSFPRSTGFPLGRALQAAGAGYRNEPAPPGPPSPAPAHRPLQAGQAEQGQAPGLRVVPKEGRAVLFWSVGGGRRWG